MNVVHENTKGLNVLCVCVRVCGRLPVYAAAGSSRPAKREGEIFGGERKQFCTMLQRIHSPCESPQGRKIFIFLRNVQQPINNKHTNKTYQ